MKKEPMKSFCNLCGKEILSDKDSVEIGLKYWEGDLSPFKHIRIVCWKCFTEHLIDLLSLRNDWELLGGK